MDGIRAELTLLAAAVLLGCADSRATPAPPVSAGEGGAPYSIDSALKVFRVGLDSLADLESAEPSIDAAFQRFTRMIEQSDTAAMRSMAMTRREFAWLYYPTSAFARKPTLQEPGIVWFLHLQNSQKGASRLMDRYAGRPLRIVSNDCKPPARFEGDNRLWFDCVQRIMEGSDTVPMRLFGGIYERNGRFKIFSYSNDL
jgi:hypothetical protein